MKGRLVLVVATLLVGGALTGCIEAFENFNQDDKGITMLQDRDLADNAAAAWNPAAFLVGAVTIETVDPRVGTPMDVEVGDGRAPLWYYAYGAPDTNETRLFLVTADGRVTSEERLPGMLGAMDFEPTPLAAFTLDSDAAVAAARAHETFGPVAAGPNASILPAIADHPEMGEPCWTVVAFSEAGFAMAMVDPNTGEVTHVEHLDMPEMPDMPAGVPMMPAFALAPPLVIRDEGTLEGDEMERTYAFDAPPGMQGVLEFEASTHQMFDTFEWRLVGPDGETLAWDTLRAWNPSGGTFEERFEFDVEMAGEHTLLLAASNTIGPFGTPLPPEPVDFWFELTVGHGVELDDEE